MNAICSFGMFLGGESYEIVIFRGKSRIYPVENPKRAVDKPVESVHNRVYKHLRQVDLDKSVISIDKGFRLCYHRFI